MKISKIFHWLYFTVMMLPCVIIPIFAIYTRNENYNSNIEVQVEENIVVDFNQQIKNGNFESTYDWYNVASAYGSFSVSDNTMYYSPTGQNGGFAQRPMLFKNNHQYLFSVNCVNLVNNYAILCYDDGYNRFACSSKGINAGTTGLINYTTTMNVGENSNIRFTIACTNNSNFGTSSFKDVMIFDLTQMGLEDININTFLTMFPNNYYTQTYSSNVMLEDQIITYNDTDVGSQFVYTLYNATDKYFNFDNFFGLDNVYSWIQLNWFSGNAPLGFAIFWHFFTYWLLASLAWLLFDVMVYVPLMIHRWMDKGAIE